MNSTNNWLLTEDFFSSSTTGFYAADVMRLDGNQFNLAVPVYSAEGTVILSKASANEQLRKEREYV